MRLFLPRGAIATMATPPLLLNRWRSVSSAESPTAEPEELVIYGYRVCPFFNKTKAVLDFHRIPYRHVEVNPLTKKEAKSVTLDSSYSLLPFAQRVRGNHCVVQINGSEEIVDDSLGVKIDSKDRKWISSHLVHVLPPNIYRTPSEALSAFDYISENANFSKTEKLMIRWAGAMVMFLVAKRSKIKYPQVCSDDPRSDLLECLKHWQNRIAESSISDPDVVALEVFGVLRSLEGNYETWTFIRSHEELSELNEWYDSIAAAMPTP